MLAAPLLATALALPGAVALEGSALAEQVRDERLVDVSRILLEAGHALTLDPAAGREVLLLSGPVAGGAIRVEAAADEQWAIQLSHPPHPQEVGRLLAHLGPARARPEGEPAVALAVAAWSPEVEAALDEALPLALLKAGYLVTGHRQAHDPKICIAAAEAEARLSVARPGQSCGRVLGRLPRPVELSPGALNRVFEDAAVKLAGEAMARARAEREPPPDEGEEDADVLGELLTSEPGDNMPFRLVPQAEDDPVELGWRLFIPKKVVASGGAGLLTRPPGLDLSARVEVRAVFVLGLSAGVVGWGTWAGEPGLPVVEGATAVGAGYEHDAGLGLKLRAGLYGGGRLHNWGGERPGTLLDPLLAVILGLRYQIFPGLDLDFTLPLIGAPARAHRRRDDSYWSRGELGIGLHLGLSYTYDLPF